MNMDDPTGAYGLFKRLCALMGDPATVGAWYRTPNAAFAGRTPNDVIVDGEIALLWQMVHQLESGVAT
jgi:hypothetical protein